MHVIPASEPESRQPSTNNPTPLVLQTTKRILVYQYYHKSTRKSFLRLNVQKGMRYIHPSWIPDRVWNDIFGCMCDENEDRRHPPQGG